MIKYAVLFFLLLTAAARASTFVMGTNQALGSQAGWFTWYSGTDSPEGAFLATLKPSSNSVTGVIPLGTTLSAGTYYLALKVYDYHQAGSVLVSFGGTSQVVTNLVPGGTTGWWTVPVPIVTSIATNSIRVTMQRTTVSSYQQIYLLRGVFISSVANTLVTSDDVVLDLNVPSVDPTAAIKGNLLDNSSFEVGIGAGGWGVQEATTRPFSIKSLLDSTRAHDGTNSVKMPNLYSLVSRVYRLRGNRAYTFSAWVSNAVIGTVTLTMKNVTPAPTGYTPTSSLAVSLAVPAGAWQRVSISTNLMAYPTADFQFKIFANDPEGGFTWMDSLQVEEDTLTDWAPRKDIELGLNCVNISNLFTNGEPAAYSIKVRNNGLAATNLSTIANTYDYFNRLLESVTNAITVPASSTFTLDKTLPPEVVSPPPTAGNTIVVATDGSGDFTTLQAAYNVANAGDTVLVKPGTYTGPSTFGGLYLNRSGTAGRPITLRSQVKWGAVLDGLNASTNYNIIGMDCSYVTIDGFDITRSYKGGMNLWSGHHNRIVNNYIHDNGGASDTGGGFAQGGLFAHQSTHHNEFIGNYIFRNGRIGLPNGTQDHGLYLCGSDDLVANNVVTYSAGWGLQIAGYDTVYRMKVFNNVFGWNGQAGAILWMSLNNIEFKNNVFYKNTTSGINAYDGHGSGIVIDHNLFFGNLTSQTDLSRGGSDFTYSLINSLTGNPLFVNETNNFVLQSTSPAIDSGLPLPQVAVDFNSVPRPQGAAYDIGAYEFSASPPVKYGVHRVFAYVDGHENTLDEVLLHVQPRLQPYPGAYLSSFGTHTDFTDNSFSIAKKLGVNWTRTVSSGSYFRWTIAEPSDDNFVYFDVDVAKAAANGIDIFGALGVIHPAWSDNSGVPKLDKWTNFVQTIVRHYKPVVKYWEIWNEPQFIFTPAVYANMLRGAVERIRIEDPTAKIVAFGGVTDYTYASQVFAYLGGAATNWGDFAATHQYPLFSPTSLANFYNYVAVTNAMPSWNTETGAWSRGYYLGNNSDFIDFDEYAWPHLASYRYQFGGRGVSELLLQNVIRTIGTGYQKYFQYDSRIYIGPAFQDTHPTWYEYDDSIRPHGSAFGVYAGLLDYARGVGKIIDTGTTIAYMYQRGTEPWASVWGTGYRSLVIPLSSAQLAVYDIMGNLVPFNGTIFYGSSPIYLKGLEITTNTLGSSLVANSSVAATDVTAPNLSFTEWPTGSTTNDVIPLRWLAVDEVSLPSSALPNAIVYSYRLDSPTVLGTWSPWTAGTTASYTSLTNDVYSFNVLAKDEAGNTSTGVIPITIGYTTPTPPPPPPDESGPLLQLEFDTSSGDVTPNIGSANVTATLVGGAVLGPGHGAGQSAVFNGLLAGVIVTPTGALNFGATNSFTTAAWIKTPVNRAVTSQILTTQGLFSQPGYTMLILNHKNARASARLRDTSNDDTGYVQNTLGVYVNNGAWHHVAMVVDRDANTLSIFTDGVKSTVKNIPTIGNVANQFGFQIGGPVYHFKGSIDSVLVYGRALSDAEVIALP